ncbi:hypothetical protein [Microbulbifer spongiae]|uniref:PAAR domain-containing protein n=1 Tax=Microbulbifer spongiae TaxID=2944933 RepID=A0ABY9E7G2_9GAMM|nr:hypothetical protein [Microbulbifer sp. MI-G]WKD48953.1 hypothetical protein M8T91_13770 [Microbulbifer sp. MI-G]
MVINSGNRFPAHCAHIGSTITDTAGQAMDVPDHTCGPPGVALKDDFAGIDVQ